MALKKKTKLESGVVADYYRIDGYTMNRKGEATVLVGLYLNEAAARADRLPLAHETAAFTIAKTAELFEGDARDKFYPLLKKYAFGLPMHGFGMKVSGSLFRGDFEDA